MESMTGVLARGEARRTLRWRREGRGGGWWEAAASRGVSASRGAPAARDADSQAGAMRPRAEGRPQPRTSTARRTLAASLRLVLGPEAPRFGASGLRNGEGAHVLSPQFLVLCYRSPPGSRDNLRTHQRHWMVPASRFARLSCRRPKPGSPERERIRSAQSAARGWSPPRRPLPRPAAPLSAAGHCDRS